MAVLSRELRLAVRRLRRAPGFAVVTVLTLSLGIGATTALYSIADAVLFRSLPFADPDALVRVFGTVEARGEDRGSVSVPDYFDWREQSRSLGQVAAFIRWSHNVAGDVAPQREWGGLVTSNFFDAMGVEPLLGRGIDPDEDRPGGEKVVVLSHALWQSLYAGDPGVLGRRLRLDDVEHTIVGVMPPGFEYPGDARLWVPLGFARDSLPRSLHALRVVARLAAGESLEAAQAEMSQIAERLAEDYPSSNSGRGVALVSLREHWTGDVRTPLLILLAATGLVLVIACVNVANLLLGRAVERRYETDLHRALGAGRSRLVLKAASEGFVLAVCGGLLGLLLAKLGVDLLVALQLAQENTSFLADRVHSVARLDQVGLDLRVLGFAAGLTLLTALVVSVVPVLRLPDGRLGQTLRAGGRGRQAGAPSLRELLVVAQVAVAVALVVGAGLLLRSYLSLAEVSPGFTAERGLTVQVSLPAGKYPSATQTTAFFRDLLERTRALPGVRSAAVAWGLPLSDVDGTTSFTIVGRPSLSADDEYVAAVQPVSAGYFETLGIPLHSGRPFRLADDEASRPVVVINETLARRYFPGEDPIGETLTFGVSFGPVGRIAGAGREIVGVVGDTKNAGIAEPPQPEMYVPLPQSTWRMMTLVATTSVPPHSLTDDVRRQVESLDPSLSTAHAQSLDRLVARSLSQAEMHAVLLGMFAGTALVLAMVGVYGVLSYSIRRRTHEIGLRMALGAERREVIRQMLGRGMLLTGGGVVLGLAAASAGTRLLSSLLFDVGTTDLATFLLVGGVTVAVGLLACYLPARRAASIDPMIVLRAE
jgi:putative ABC transport system permease protein